MPTSNILISALLAGQYAAAAYIPINNISNQPNVVIQSITLTQTVYAPASTISTTKPRKTVTSTSTHIVYETPTVVGINPINGLPAPTARPPQSQSSTETKPSVSKSSTARMCGSGQGRFFECANPTARPSMYQTKSFSSATTTLATTTRKVTSSTSQKSNVGIVVTPVTTATRQVSPSKSRSNVGIVITPVTIANV